MRLILCNFVFVNFFKGSSGEGGWVRCGYTTNNELALDGYYTEGSLRGHPQ